MNRNQTNVLGIACEPRIADPNEAALKAVSKCERIALPRRLGPPDPLETLRVTQGSPSREHFVKSTLAAVVKSEAGNPELQRRAAHVVAAYCERHGLAVPSDVRKCLTAATSSATARPAHAAVQAIARPTIVKGTASPGLTEELRRQSSQIADLKRRIAELQRGKR